MSIKTATRIAIFGTSIAALMSIIATWFGLALWLYGPSSGLSREQAERFLQIYYTIMPICFQGSIILFLATLYSKQKGE